MFLNILKFYNLKKTSDCDDDKQCFKQSNFTIELDSKACSIEHYLKSSIENVSMHVSRVSIDCERAAREIENANTREEHCFLFQRQKTARFDQLQKNFFRKHRSKDEFTSFY